MGSQMRLTPVSVHLGSAESGPASTPKLMMPVRSWSAALVLRPRSTLHAQAASLSCSPMDDSSPRRHVILEGCLNLRDLGGYPTADFRQVRQGCLFRSDELCALTTGDLHAISNLGVQVVFDLRNDLERSRRPNRLPPRIEVLERQSPGSDEGRTTEERVAGGDLPERDDSYMTAMYVDLLTRLAPELRILVERAADAPARPLLFHCAAGKDRTGIAAALLLGLLGVSDEIILDDYELTTTLAAPRRLEAMQPLLREHHVSEQRVRPLLEVRRVVLASALAHVYQEWGSFEHYAIDVLRVPPDLPERLRISLLVPTHSQER
jgi:protein-tyrosine phosphatase